MSATKPTKKWRTGFCAAGNHQHCRHTCETPSTHLVCDCSCHTSQGRLL